MYFVDVGKLLHERQCKKQVVKTPSRKCVVKYGVNG